MRRLLISAPWAGGEVGPDCAGRDPQDTPPRKGGRRPAGIMADLAGRLITVSSQPDAKPRVLLIAQEQPRATVFMMTMVGLLEWILEQVAAPRPTP